MSVILPGDKELDPEPSLTKKSLRINLNENKHHFPFELKNNVTSIKILTKKNQKKENVLIKILNKITINYNNMTSIHSKWISKCGHINKNIIFHTENKKIKGEFMGITQNGHAVMKINNKIHFFPNGELSL